jgi:hypothetical protein
MKRIFLFFFLILLISSCAKSDDCDSVFKYSPAEFSLYLELKNGETFFEDEEVSISNKHEMQNGVLSPIPFYNNQVIWDSLYQVENNYLNFDTTVFGYKATNTLGHTFFYGVFVGMGPPSPCGYDNRTEWERNSYYLLKFPDKTIDTLRIQDKKKRFGFPEYTIYVNGIKADYYININNYITIQK